MFSNVAHLTASVNTQTVVRLNKTKSLVERVLLKAAKRFAKQKGRLGAILVGCFCQRFLMFEGVERSLNNFQVQLYVCAANLAYFESKQSELYLCLFLMPLKRKLDSLCSFSLFLLFIYDI